MYKYCLSIWAQRKEGGTSDTMLLTRPIYVNSYSPKFNVIGDSKEVPLLVCWFTSCEGGVRYPYRRTSCLPNPYRVSLGHGYHPGHL